MLIWTSERCKYCFNGKNRHMGTFELVERNYHGCGVDIVVCNDCKRTFQVSYKVDKVIEI